MKKKRLTLEETAERLADTYREIVIEPAQRLVDELNKRAGSKKDVRPSSKGDHAGSNPARRTN